MYIIREEMEDQDDDLSNISHVAESTPPRVGGLSRALSKQTSSSRWSRSFSLHNLLDQEEFDEGVVPANNGAVLGRRLSTAVEEDEAEDSESEWDRKQSILEGVNELIEELKDIDSTIAAHAPEHIHANEVILVFGYSRTILHFLKRAKEKRDFQVVVAEGSPKLEGGKMALELGKSGIRTTVIADASCYAMMARANKVIISAHAILADGGVMAPVGTSSLAAAARRHNVPVVILAGIYKLSPNFPHEPGVTFNDFGEPYEVLPFSHESIFAAERAGMFLQMDVFECLVLFSVEHDIYINLTCRGQLLNNG